MTAENVLNNPQAMFPHRGHLLGVLRHIVFLLTQEQNHYPMPISVNLFLLGATLDSPHSVHFESSPAKTISVHSMESESKWTNKCSSVPQGRFISPDSTKRFDLNPLIIRSYEGQNLISYTNLVFGAVCQKLFIGWRGFQQLLTDSSEHQIFVRNGFLTFIWP